MRRGVNALMGGVSMFAGMTFAGAVEAQILSEDIVVTAQKREQDLSEVPISITALSGDQMEKLGIERLQDLFKQAPGVSVNENGPALQLSVRGIQLYDFGDSNEPPVGLYIDEVYMGTLAGHSASTFDIERAEVLRGPQGTLFGRNTTGGLVHFVTRKPTREFEGYVAAQYGSFDQRMLEGAVSGPLSDQVRARVAVKYNEDDGWQKSETTGSHFAATDRLSGRAQLEVDVTDDVTVLFNIHGARVRDTSKHFGLMGLVDPATGSRCAPERARAGECIAGFGIPSLLDHRRVESERLKLHNNIDTYGGFARLTWDLGDKIELTSISAYESVDRFYEQDADSSLAPIFYSIDAVKAEQFTQELRLSGRSKMLQWVAGAFYYTDSKDMVFQNPTIVQAFGTDVGFENDSHLDLESWAVFGQADVYLTEQFYVTAGLRYTHDDKKLVISNDFANPIFTDHEFIDTGNLTWKIGGTWLPSDDLMAFASVSKGFKSGAFKTTFSRPGEAAPTGEENVISYEAGLKAEVIDNRLNVNASIFYYDYSDLQAQSVSSRDGTASSLLLNIGDVSIKGAEFEATGVITDNLETAVGISLLDTKIHSTVLSTGGIPFDGNEMAVSPPVSINGIVRYTVPAPIFGGETTLQTNAVYKAAHFLTPENQLTMKQDGYVIWDARVSWAAPGDKWTLEAFVENILDEQYASAAFTVDVLAFNSIIWERPRSWGVRARVSF
jgi:iron complex outermembrane receptor protein